MSTKNLIDNLSKDLTRVRPLPTLQRRWFNILAVSILGLGATFWLFSIRHNLSDVIHTKQFIFGAVLLLITWVVSAFSLANLELPSSRENKCWRISLVLLTLLVVVYLMAGVASGLDSMAGGLHFSGLPCSLDIAFLSILPGIFVFYFLRRSATTAQGLIGANLGLCCGALAAFALQFSCPKEAPTHLMLWHIVLPLLILAGLGWLIGRKFLKW